MYRTREIPEIRQLQRDETYRIAHNTTGWLYSDGSYSVCLYQTHIMSVTADGVIRVHFGHWGTVTTLQRVNQLLPYGWRIGRHKGELNWYYMGEFVHPYNGNEAILADGTFVPFADRHGLAA